MNLNKIIVSAVGLLGIYFIYWFFLAKKSTTASAAANAGRAGSRLGGNKSTKPEINKTIATGSVEIIVRGGYNPEVITIPSGRPTVINFLRKDPSSCLEEVNISDFKIRKFLPLNEKVSVTITPYKPGEYDFVCGMNMFHGKIIVV